MTAQGAVLTSAEVCERLRIHPNTLTAILPTLRHFRIGHPVTGHIRVRAADLEDWMQRRIVATGGVSDVSRPAGVPQRDDLPAQERRHMGGDIRAAQAVAGHQNVQTTVNTYGKEADEARKRAAEAWDRAMQSRTNVEKSS